MRSGESLLRFLVVTFSVVIILYSLSYQFFPRQPPSIWEILTGAVEDETNTGFFKRLFRSGRPDAAAGSLWRQSSHEEYLVRNWRTGDDISGRGVGMNLSRDRLVLREFILAHAVLLDRYDDVVESDVWKAARKIKCPEVDRNYEEQRLLSEILWMNYKNNDKDPVVLQKLRRTALLLVDHPSSFFEDRFNAGISSLLAGDSSNALINLDRAISEWPSTGRARGNVYLGLMLTHAVENHPRDVLRMLSVFRDSFPDWLYLETFVPDILALKEIYPESALLHVVHGRLVQFANDFATAKDLYRTALATNKLDRFVSLLVRGWINSIEDSNIQ